MSEQQQKTSENGRTSFDPSRYLTKLSRRQRLPDGARRVWRHRRDNGRRELPDLGPEWGQHGDEREDPLAAELRCGVPPRQAAARNGRSGRPRSVGHRSRARRGTEPGVSRPGGRRSAVWDSE